MAQAGGGADGGVSLSWGTEGFNEGFKSGDICSWGFPRTESVSQGMMKTGKEKGLVFFPYWGVVIHLVVQGGKCFTRK